MQEFVSLSENTLSHTIRMQLLDSKKMHICCTNFRSNKMLRHCRNGNFLAREGEMPFRTTTKLRRAVNSQFRCSFNEGL